MDVYGNYFVFLCTLGKKHIFLGVLKICQAFYFKRGGGVKEPCQWEGDSNHNGMALTENNTKNNIM